MKRSTGVTVVAILVILGSVFTLWMGLFVLRAGAHVSPGARQIPFFWRTVISGVILCFGCAGWGLATAIGLLRLKRWARHSILVFSGLLVLFSAMTSLVVLVLPMPSPPNVSPALLTRAQVGIAAFHVFLAGLGVWWLVYFTRSGVKAQFEGSAVGGGASTIPLGIRIVAWLLLMTGVMTPFYVSSHFPAIVFGILLTGWRASALYLAYGVAEILIGLGLLKQKALSHTFAVLFCLFGVLNAVTFLVLPDRAARIAAMISLLPEHMKVLGANGVKSAAWYGPLVGLMFMGVLLWLLMSGRKRFLTGTRPPAV